MKYLILLLCSLASLPAWAGSDPVQACRETHGGNADAHIACLEAALSDLLGADASADAAESAAAPAAARIDDEPVGLGAEQLRAQPRPEEAAIDSEQVRIIASRYDASGKGTFMMEDGQVWRETMAAPERARLDPNRQYEARIERGKLSGYRLYVDGVHRMLTIRRIK